MSNIKGTPLSWDYSEFDNIKMQVGPYVMITEEILNDEKFRWIAEYFYKLKYTPGLDTIILREL